MSVLWLTISMDYRVIPQHSIDNGKYIDHYPTRLPPESVIHIIDQLITVIIDGEPLLQGAAP